MTTHGLVVRPPEDAVARADGHVHLTVSRGASAPRNADWNRARGLVVGLGIAAAALFALSFFRDWWSFVLYAPQYPGGLRLQIALTGMGGDVHEIDLLNHYIGMHHLENAAPVERRLAGYGVAAIALLTVALATASGRRFNKLLALPALAFPLLFLADSFYWLYSFGHHLDAHAPLKIGAFTPQMFGNGKIGQFETYAEPALGFWLAVAGVACVVAAAFVRSRVCAGCSHAETCRVACPRLMVRSDSPKEQHA
ncbi:MAG TPA: hypothetical protein VGI39_17335 [Polyangiaceae bacterium]|jgi:hypothetical protein